MGTTGNIRDLRIAEIRKAIDELLEAMHEAQLRKKMAGDDMRRIQNILNDRYIELREWTGTAKGSELKNDRPIELLRSYLQSRGTWITAEEAYQVMGPAAKGETDEEKRANLERSLTQSITRGANNPVANETIVRRSELIGLEGWE